jgi:hypothetical protein
VSKILKENIDKLIAIEKGAKWQLRVKHPSNNWQNPPQDACPLYYLSIGYEIRLLSKLHWVDYSHKPKERPKGVVQVRYKATGYRDEVKFSKVYGLWYFSSSQSYRSDAVMLELYEQRLHDGSEIPFGAAVVK